MAIAETQALIETAAFNSGSFGRADIQETSIMLSERRGHKVVLPQAQPIATQTFSSLWSKPLLLRESYFQHIFTSYSVSQAVAPNFSYSVSRMSASRDDTTQASWSNVISGLERLSIHGYLHSRLSLRLKFWISEVNFLVSEVRLPWTEPLINYVDQEVSLEWWNANKKLTIYFSEDAIDYIRVWGPNIKNEMEDGEIMNPFFFVALWQWLLS
jgi:hypothetical protein